MEYNSIDHILAEEELLPVSFNKAANGVKINEDTEKNFIEQGFRTELPIWLAHELYLRQAVSVGVPPCFNQKTRVEIQACAGAVDLKSRSPFFYELGCKIAPMCDKTINALLSYAFSVRYKEILHKSHTMVSSKALPLLTNEEINLYEASQASMAQFKKWRKGGPTLQKASVLGRKRRQFS